MLAKAGASKSAKRKRAGAHESTPLPRETGHHGQGEVEESQGAGGSSLGTEAPTLPASPVHGEAMQAPPASGGRKSRISQLTDLVLKQSALIETLLSRPHVGATEERPQAPIATMEQEGMPMAVDSPTAAPEVPATLAQPPMALANVQQTQRHHTAAANQPVHQPPPHQESADSEDSGASDEWFDNLRDFLVDLGLSGLQAEDLLDAVPTLHQAKDLARELRVRLPKVGSAMIRQAARELVNKGGPLTYKVVMAALMRVGEGRELPPQAPPQQAPAEAHVAHAVTPAPPPPPLPTEPATPTKTPGASPAAQVGDPGGKWQSATGASAERHPHPSGARASHSGGYAGQGRQ